MFSVGFDVSLIDRTVYNTFNLLGDVGGFSGLLFAVGSQIVSFLTFNNPENRLVERLYVTSSQSSERCDQDKLNASKQSAFKEYLQDLLPKCCLSLGCLRRRKSDLRFLKGREKFQDEMDLVKHL